jgi:hypothetical protein
MGVRHPVADAARGAAGVGDQKRPCPNGTSGCPGPNRGRVQATCWDCFVDGGADDV